MNVSLVSPTFGAATLRLPTVREDDNPRGNRYAESLKPLLGRVVDLRQNLQGMRDAVQQRSNQTLAGGVNHRAVSVHSRQAIGLNRVPTAATLSSTEEINTVSTSFTPLGPTFYHPSTPPNGSSTSVPTVGGTYDGSDGDEEYTFRIRRGGNVGGPYTGRRGNPGRINVEVLRADGSKLQDVRFDESFAPNTIFNLSNGLTVSFGAGSVARNEIFKVNAYTSQSSRVDPDKPVDGTRNNDPGFEPGLTVRAGTFQVNGQTVRIQSGDTLRDVLNSINNSGAGVTAAFDDLTERITLTQNTVGSAGQIDLANDTTGFLAATKLSSATLNPGRDDDIHRLIREVPAFASIRGGNFFINDTEFRLHPGRDSVQDVLDRINAARIGVTADYVNDRVLIRSTNRKARVVLDDGRSRFFSGSQVAPGDYQPREESRAPDRAETRRLARQMSVEFQDIGERIKGLFDGLRATVGRQELGNVREAIQAGVRSAFINTLGYRESMFRADGPLKSNLGFDFTMDQNSPYFFHTSELELSRVLERDPDKVMEFLFAKEDVGEESGLFESILKNLTIVEQSLTSRSGTTTGALLDELA